MVVVRETESGKKKDTGSSSYSICAVSVPSIDCKPLGSTLGWSLLGALDGGILGIKLGKEEDGPGDGKSEGSSLGSDEGAPVGGGGGMATDSSSSSDDDVRDMVKSGKVKVKSKLLSLLSLFPSSWGIILVGRSLGS